MATKPANTIANGQPGSIEIDHKLVAAATYSAVKAATDLGADYSTEFTAPINAQQTSTVIVRIKPTLELAEMPAERDGLLARTGITGGSVEVTLDTDRYFKVAVDGQGVKPGQVETEIGEAGGEAIVREGNRNLLATLVSEGTQVEADTSDAQGVWSALLDAKVTFQEGELTEQFVGYVRPAIWATLLEDVAALKTAVNPQERAAQLLGFEKLHVVNLPGADAVVAHRGSVAQAKVLSGITSGQEDFDTVVRGRIRVGSKVLAEDAVAVIVPADIEA